jgi:hypothetical protein
MLTLEGREGGCPLSVCCAPSSLSRNTKAELSVVNQQVQIMMSEQAPVSLQVRCRVCFCPQALPVEDSGSYALGGLVVSSLYRVTVQPCVHT